MAEAAEEKLDENDCAPSGDLAKDDHDAGEELQEAGKSSKLDKLLQRLQDQGQGSAEHSRESSPDPSSKDTGQASRQSRRKPKVTRKVVEDTDAGADGSTSAPAETPEDDDVIDAAMSMAIHEFLTSSKLDEEASDHEQEEDSPGKTKETKSGEQNLMDEDGNLILPEGTVVVQPEAVTDNQPVFKGPEFRSTGAGPRKSIGTTVAGEVDLSTVHCTGCNEQINTNKQNAVKRHPVLKVMLCKKCYNYYTSDEIAQDADGMDEQCRWCGEGGDLLCCDYCHNGFCKGCIRRNLGRGELSTLLKADPDTKWHCYVCDPKPLAELIQHGTVVMDAIEVQEKKLKEREAKKEEKKKKQPPPTAKQMIRTPQGLQHQGNMKGQKPQTVMNILTAQQAKQQKCSPPGNMVKGRLGPQMTNTPQGSPGASPTNRFLEWNFRVSESNVMPIIDRAMMVTESFHLLLSSLREDIQKAATMNAQQRISTKVECGGNLKRALNAFNKSFFDLSVFSQKTAGPTTVRKMLENQPQQGRGRPSPAQQHQLQKQLQQKQFQLQVERQKQLQKQLQQKQQVRPVHLVAHGSKLTPGRNQIRPAIQQRKVTPPHKSAPKPQPKASGKVEFIDLLDDSEEEKKSNSSSPPKKKAEDKEGTSEDSSKKKGFQLKVALGGPGHKLKGPLSKKRKVEEQEAKEKERKEKEEEEKNEAETVIDDDDSEKAQESENEESTAKDEEEKEEAAMEEDEPAEEVTTEDAPADEAPMEVEQEEEEEKDQEEEEEQPAEEDQDDSGDLENFRSVEEQLKQLNGGFSDSEDLKTRMSKDTESDSVVANGKVVMQVDGVFDSKSDTNDDSSVSDSSDDEASDGSKNEAHDDMFAELQFDPLFDLDEISNSDSGAEDNHCSKVTFDLGNGDDDDSVPGGDDDKLDEDVDMSLKRTREDIEAQRVLHKEFLNGDSSSEEEKKKGEDKDSDDSDDSEESGNTSGEAYLPKKDEKRPMEREKKPGRGRPRKGQAPKGKKDLRCIIRPNEQKSKRGADKDRKSEHLDSSSDTHSSKQDSANKKSGKKEKSPVTSSEHSTKKGKGQKQKSDEEEDHKKCSDDSSCDSDLDADIEKLSKMPKLKDSKKKGAKKQLQETEESAEEKEVKKDIKKKGVKKQESEKEDQKEKSTKKGKGPSSKKAKKGTEELVADLSSGEEEAEDLESSEEDEPDSDQDQTSQPEDLPRDKAEDDARARKALLDDSSSTEADDASTDEDYVNKPKKNKKTNKVDKTTEEIDGDSDSDFVTMSKKRQRTALLEANLSDSDASQITKKRKKKSSEEDFDENTSNDESDSVSDSVSESDSEIEGKKKGKKGKKKNTSSEYETDSEIEAAKSTKKKKGKGKKKKKKSASSEVESDSEEETVKKKKKKKKKKKSAPSEVESDSEDETVKKKKKRRRVKIGSDSSNEANSSQDSDDEDASTPGKKRKKIRRIMRAKKQSEAAQWAGKAEDDRRDRVKERQELYNQMTVVDEQSPTKCPITTQLYLEVDKESQKPKIEVVSHLLRKLKPHQVEAVKFLWDCCAETTKQLQKETGSGCILAHCMGLGKTLSVITLIHTLMKNAKKTKIHTCLVVCPLNTVLNWQAEFEKWLEDDDSFDVWEMSGIKDNHNRAEALRDWQESGGIMIMGYEMYRNLTSLKRLKKKKLKEAMTETLVNPGPDIVVCDEGHILKNAASSLSKAMNQIHTRRRIVLTGTPLQNNLIEYHCMVDFVKPNLLGTKKEFLNQFVNPITNGQCSDSTPHDVKIMKRRAHILHEKLAGCVQRKDYSALTQFLMPKYEYIVSIRLAPVQCKLYRKYLEMNMNAMTINGRIHNKGARLFTDYQYLMKIWTHPWALRLDEMRREHKAMLDDDDDMSSFLDDEDTEKSMSASSSNNSDVEIVSETRGRATRSQKNNRDDDDDDDDKDEEDKNDRDEVVKDWKTRSRSGTAPSPEPNPEIEYMVSREWWGEFLTDEDQYKTEIGGKLKVLAEILRMCESIGDKVLVFSQSLISLNLIEMFLESWDNFSKENPDSPIAGTGSWLPRLDYYRMDGSTSAQTRKSNTCSFNDEDNPRMRLFLISTKAGCLGINLVSANRVVVFDASWNPTHDIQSIFRVYRFGQEKPVYVYRFIAQGTMEEKVYERQVMKQSLSQRVVDEHQIERHFSAADLQELYNFTPDELDDPNRKENPTPKLPKDRLLAELLTSHKEWIVGYHEHDSLLENKEDETLTEEERKAAWEEFEEEKKGIFKRPNSMTNMAMYNHYGMGQAANSSGNLQTFVPEAEQVARAIYAANPGISHQVLQQKVHMYLQQRMEQYRILASQRQQMEMMKMQQQMGQYRQQDYLDAVEQQQRGQGYSGLMQHLASGSQSQSASTQQLASSSSEPNLKTVANGSGDAAPSAESESKSSSTNLLNLLHKATSDS